MLIALDVSKALIEGPSMFLFNETVDLKTRKSHGLFYLQIFA